MIIYKCDLCGKEFEEQELKQKSLYYTVISNYPQIKNFDLCRECEKAYEMAMAKASAEYIALKEQNMKKGG